MALLGNYSVQTKLPLRHRGGYITAGTSYAGTYGNRAPSGWSNMIWQDKATESLPHIEYPSGYRGTGWKMPLGLNTSLTVKYGLLSGQTAVITVTGSGGGAPARPGSGSATITITADGTAGLVIMGSGSATLTIDALAEIVAQLTAEGAATITIIAEGDTLEALGWPVGTATITLTAEADPMAWGWMEGTTEEAGLSPTGIANAVWNALAEDSNEAGTMGQKLNAAGTAGDPWTADLDSYTADQAGGILRDNADDTTTKVWEYERP